MRRSLWAFLFFLFGVCLVASDETGELLAGTSLFGDGDRLVIRLAMTITESGQDKNRELELFLERNDGEVRSLARILSPAFLSGMKFLKRSEPGHPDAQWIKTSSGLRRLGASNGSERVFGSHFTVEDFGSINASNFVLSPLPEADDATTRAIRALPREPAPYAERIIRVERESGLIVAMECRDGEGRLIKRYSVISASGTGKDRRPEEAVMEDFFLKGSTRLRLLSLETPSSIPERLFNPGAL